MMTANKIGLKSIPANIGICLWIGITNGKNTASNISRIMVLGFKT
jgi:hypothetical protein